MSDTRITIRISVDARAALEAAAAREDRTLSAYIRRELEALAAHGVEVKPTPPEPPSPQPHSTPEPVPPADHSEGASVPHTTPRKHYEPLSKEETISGRVRRDRRAW